MRNEQNSEHHQFWLDFKSNQNFLLSPIGSAIWAEGLSKLNCLNQDSFSKEEFALTTEDRAGLNLIEHLINEKDYFSYRQFFVTGHLQLMYVSKLYKTIQQKAANAQIQYEFTENDIDDYSPWTNKVLLGKKFYSTFKNVKRIPFYTFNHDNAHLVLFKDYYSNIPILDSELSELIILIEWFCISLDLILAYDLLKHESFDCLQELNTIPNKHKKSIQSAFFQNCGTVSQINKFALKFRTSFLESKECMLTESLISRQVMQNHIAYAKNNLLANCRKISSNIEAQSARNLIELLRTCSLTKIIENKMELIYED